MAIYITLYMLCAVTSQISETVGDLFFKIVPRRLLGYCHCAGNV